VEKEKEKEKKKKPVEVTYTKPVVMCECDVQANYGLLPSELGIGWYCGRMIDYEEVGYFN
jgi:hypothetical protein